MRYRDLREFLSLLEQENQLVRIKDPVMPEPDLSAIGRAAPNLENGPAVFIEEIMGYKNSVALNVQGSWQNHALMLNLPKDTSIKEQFFALDRLWNDYPVKPVWVTEEDAPVKENKVKENVNLFDILPLHRVNKFDGGFFISKGDRPRYFGTTLRVSFRQNPGGRRRVLPMKKGRYTEEQIAYALRQAELGTPVVEVVRKRGVSEQTFYRWKKQYAGMGVGEIRRLKQLEEENRKLKQRVADLSLDKLMSQDVLSKKL